VLNYFVDFVYLEAGIIGSIDVDVHRMPKAYVNEKLTNGLFHHFLPNIHKYMSHGAYFALSLGEDVVKALRTYHSTLSQLFYIDIKSSSESKFIESVVKYEDEINQ
jgi:hypothetical protein